VGGTIFADVQADISSNYFVPQYVYKTETKKITLAASFMGVVNWVGSEGSLNLNDFSRRSGSAVTLFYGPVLSLSHNFTKREINEKHRRTTGFKDF
jgi:hypothetical protein